MSGIAAVWRLDGAPLHQATLDRMIERLAPPAADAVGTWLDGPVGLGHRMLHATPESLQEKLPLAGDTGEVVVTADARLDNRVELMSALGLAHRVADGVSDGELVLRAWERWGEECPARLLGDFAFALWDARRRVLFCARDPAGVKPLYYHLGSRLVAVASETKALLAIPDVPRRLDEISIAACLVPGLDDRVATFYEGILRLPAGHCLTVTAGGGTARAYWQLDPTRELRPGSDAELRGAVPGAVHRRGAVPPAKRLPGRRRAERRARLVVGGVRRPGSSGSGGNGTAGDLHRALPDDPALRRGRLRRRRRGPGRARAPASARRHARPAGRSRGAAGAGGRDVPRSRLLHARRPVPRGAVRRRAGLPRGNRGRPRRLARDGYLHDLARQGRWLALGREIQQLSRSFQRPSWRTLRGSRAPWPRRCSAGPGDTCATGGSSDRR